MVMVTFFRYQYVRLDGTMSIKKRQKIVDRFNDPHVSSIKLVKMTEAFMVHSDGDLWFNKSNITLILE